MKRTILALLALSFGYTQAQDLPQPSPVSTVEQRVGLTDVKVVYSRPSKKDRIVFGELVPYNQLWRTGANQNTMVEFSTPVSIMGTAIEAGKYSLLTIPSEGEWTIILNKKTDMWGTDGYDEGQDVLRVQVPAGTAPMTETFTIQVADITPNSAQLVLMWEETMVAIPMEMDSKELALKNIAEALKTSSEENLWRVYRNSANYYLQNNMNLVEAETYINKSIGLKSDSWYSYWLKAEILAAQGKNKEAVKSAQMAIKVGREYASKNNTEFGYEEMISTEIEKWQKA